MNVVKRIRKHPLIINSKSAKSEIISMNNHRIYLLSAVLMVIHLAHGIIFLMFNPEIEATANVHKWRMGIAYSHLVMFAVASMIGVVAFFLKRKKADRGVIASLLQIITILGYLIFSIILSAIDQYVNAGINAFLIACIGIGVIFLMNPIQAVITYGLAFFLFHFGISLTQLNHDILLSERVNSISAIGISFGIALILWRNSIYKIMQEKEIEAQNKILEEKNKQLEFLATHDSLTGLLNRMEFMKITSKEMAKMNRTNSETCIVLMDIDHFKHVNDDFGHPTGDKVLKEVGIILTEILSRQHYSARLGGEEFIFLLPETTLQEGILVAEKIKTMIQLHLFTYGNESIKVTASLGVASLNITEADPFTSCYHRADIALYQAKNGGRNRVVSAE
jgi:diguanylate cyclase